MTWSGVPLSPRGWVNFFTMSFHAFDAHVAAEFGVIEAVIIKNFQFWILHNKRNGSNLRDGRTWTYNSTRALVQAFPYLTQKQIYGVLKRLQDKGILITGNYNATKYDRTIWYAFAQEEDWIFPDEKLHFTRRENGLPQKVQPIPVTNTVTNTDKNPQTPAGGEVWEEVRNRMEQSGQPPPRASEHAGVIWPWETETFWDAWVGWREYKQKQHKFVFKLKASEQAALNHLRELSGDSEAEAQAIMRQSMANGWKGFFKLKIDNDGKNQHASAGGTRQGVSSARMDALHKWD